MLTVVLEELESAGQGGGVLGFPLMRLKATVLGGQIGEAGLSEIAFRTATNQAFDTALREAKPVLLEPIMRLEINTPDEHVGDLVSDLQQRRAIIHQTESRGINTVLHAEAPLANLFGYSSAMRSLSQGRASCSMEPSDYAPAPPDVLQKILGRIVSRGMRATSCFRRGPRWRGGRLLRRPAADRGRVAGRGSRDTARARFVGAWSSGASTGRRAATRLCTSLR